MLWIFFKLFFKGYLKRYGSYETVIVKIKLLYKSRREEKPNVNINIQDSRQYLILYKHSFSYKNSGCNLRTQLDHFLYGTNENKGFCQNKVGHTLSHNASYQQEVQRNRINSPAPTLNSTLGS